MLATSLLNQTNPEYPLFASSAKRVPHPRAAEQLCRFMRPAHSFLPVAVVTIWYQKLRYGRKQMKIRINLGFATGWRITRWVKS
ncbi:hypothetical protein KCP77_01420 [Salmonella enterica subsp. enterica]|nr:hypothetical protein KCP77_01420 [Salmonella enterica subsp. enterica]